MLSTKVLIFFVVSWLVKDIQASILRALNPGTNEDLNSRHYSSLTRGRSIYDDVFVEDSEPRESFTESDPEVDLFQGSESDATEPEQEDEGTQGSDIRPTESEPEFDLFKDSESYATEPEQEDEETQGTDIRPTESEPEFDLYQFSKSHATEPEQEDEETQGADIRPTESEPEFDLFQYSISHATEPEQEDEETQGSDIRPTESEPEFDLFQDSESYAPEPDRTTSTSYAVSCTEVAKPVKEEKRFAIAVFFKANWFRASQYCKYRGMELATITSQEEEDMLESSLGKIGFDLGGIWTSGTDMAEEGNFFWMSTGTPVTYTNWFQGEPNGKNHENCLLVFRGAEGYHWNDVPCDLQYYFACEYYTSNFTEVSVYV